MRAIGMKLAKLIDFFRIHPWCDFEIFRDEFEESLKKKNPAADLSRSGDGYKAESTQAEWDYYKYIEEKKGTDW